MKERNRVHVIATQHLDVAWLWPRAPQGEDLMRQCFEMAIEMIEAWPDSDFVFSRSTAWSFWIMEQRYPELFEKIRRYVAEGKIELCGGEWVEPDHLMPDGEALVRQCAYGQWYYQQRFGKIASVCWVPDIFGHAGTMPQILRKSGLNGYYFHRCRPKDERGRTLHQFLWEGPDGSGVFVLSGNWVHRPDKQVIARAQAELEESGLPAAHVVTGSHSDRRITMLPEWVPDPGQADADPQLPACRWSSADDVLRDMESYAERLPVVRGECGFESTGTYTSNGHVKRANRRVEALLMDAEKIASWAWMDGWRYPSEQLAQAWRDLCVNQFHDLICGCSHQDAMLEALDLFSESELRARWTIERATDFLVRRMKTDAVPGADPLVVFNTLSWPRRGEVVVRRRDAERIEVVRRNGAVVSSQTIKDPDGSPAVLFVTDDLNGIASDVYYIRPRAERAELAATNEGSPLIVRQDRLENECLVAEFDAAGALKRLFDKRLKAEMLEPGKAGNLLRFYHDAREQAEAWVIGELGEFQPETQIEASIVETGPLRACLRFTRRTRLCDDLPPTILVQDISLRAGSAILRFETHGDWQARETMLKAEFNLSFPCETVVAEAPYGVVERSTNSLETTGELDADSAPEDGQAGRTAPPKPDRPMQKWLDFSDGKKGVAFLNNGKYGYDAHARVLRLSLLRAPFMRRELDEVLGLGPFSFAYAVMPHAGDWREADLPKRGHEFNYDLLTVRHDRPDLVDRRLHERVYTGPRREPHVFVAASGSSALLTVVKRAEDGDALILRLVETLGREATARIAFHHAIQGAVECDLLERPADRGPCAVQPSGRLTIDGAGLTVSLQPFEIKTIRVFLFRK